MMNVIASVILVCVAVVWVIPVAESSCDLTACTSPPTTMNSTSNDTSAFCLQQNNYLSCLREERSSCDTFTKLVFDAAIADVETIIVHISNCEITSGAPMTVYSMLLCLVCVTFSLLWR
uniref:Sperm protein n=1 Tax=Haliotis discus TaxID=36094 RepID=M9WB02_HALDI|nr:sperm protein [Haliotis discus]